MLWLVVNSYCLMLFIWHYLLSAPCLTCFIQRYLLNAIVAFATLCSMLLLFLLFFAWCSLFNVAIPFVAFCSTLLHFLLLLVWCCCSSYYLFDATTPFVVLCLTLIFFVICLTLQNFWSFVFNVGFQIPFCYVMCCCYFVLCFLLDATTPILPILDWFPFWFFVGVGGAIQIQVFKVKLGRWEILKKIFVCWWF